LRKLNTGELTKDLNIMNTNYMLVTEQY